MSTIKNHIKKILKLDLTCQEVHQFLMDYLDNKLSQEVQVRFDNHMRICKNCRVYLAQYKQTVNLLKEQPIPTPPNKLVEHTLTFLSNKFEDDTEKDG